MLIKLTNPMGDPVWIGPTWVQRVVAARGKEFTPKVNTEITLSGVVQGVQETPVEVVELLEAVVHG